MEVLERKEFWFLLPAMMPIVVGIIVTIRENQKINIRRNNKMNIKPFKAIRPTKGLESQIAALPYDVYNRLEAKAEVEKEPLSFLKIDRAETMFSDDVSPYEDQVYEKASSQLWSMLEKGEFTQDPNPCYYIYDLIMNDRSQTGIVACASIDDYQNQLIKKHENTRVEKELDRIKHVSVCKAQTGPIFLAYREQNTITELINQKKTEAPLYDFVAPDNIIHRVWLIDQESSVNFLQEELARLEALYIADGHHRCASAVKVGLQKRIENPNYTGEEEFNYFLSVLFPDNQLMIMDYNRVVKDLNGHTQETFLAELEKIVTITKQENLQENNSEHNMSAKISHYPNQKGEISMYIGENWYLLTIKSAYKSNDPVLGLDVSILQEEILGPILGIKDPKVDNRIDFVGGIRGLKELEERVHSDSEVAFAMFPTQIRELFQVADANLLMPPKSTWFEPKLRSGLFLHSIKE